MYKANVIGAVSYHEKYFYGSLYSVIWSITNQIDGADKCAFNWIYPVRQLPYILPVRRNLFTFDYLFNSIFSANRLSKYISCWFNSIYPTLFQHSSANVNKHFAVNFFARTYATFSLILYPYIFRLNCVPGSLAFLGNGFNLCVSVCVILFPNLMVQVYDKEKSMGSLL